MVKTAWIEYDCLWELCLIKRERELSIPFLEGWEARHSTLEHAAFRLSNAHFYNCSPLGFCVGWWDEVEGKGAV
jgi:hypothetical protein